MHTRVDQPPPIATTDPHSITDLGEFVDSMVASGRSAFRSERDYLTFMASKRMAETGRNLLGSLATFALLGVTLVMASLGAAIWVGRELGDLVLGFAVVTGFYLLFALVFGALWKGSLGNKFIVNLINSLHGHR